MPRPRIYPKGWVRVTVALPQLLIAWLGELSATSGSTRSELVVSALRWARRHGWTPGREEEDE
jgi:metal-responsive CopG/Arc/MetJ family transcriptional regulator